RDGFVVASWGLRRAMAWKSPVSATTTLYFSNDSSTVILLILPIQEITGRDSNVADFSEAGQPENGKLPGKGIRLSHLPIIMRHVTLFIILSLSVGTDAGAADR